MDKKKLLSKYLDNHCTPEELIVVLEWLKTDDGKRALTESMDNKWEQESDFHSTPSLWISHTNQDESEKPKLRKYLVAAASLILFAICGYYLADLTREGNGNLIVEDLTSSTVKQNSAGRKTTFHLPDGSVVTLNSESSLKYGEEFHGIREVFLTGEAFFDVVPNPETPFIVRMKNLSVTVLGTSFNVRAFEEDNEVDICLSEGKVLVEKEGDSLNTPQSVLLDPGQKAIFNKQKEKFSLDSFDPGIELAWKDNIIAFDGNSFEYIEETIERWYGVEILVEDESLTKDWEFTGRFINSTLQDVMTNIVFARELGYTIEDDVVVIYSPKTK